MRNEIQLKIDMEPKKLLIVSEPYVRYTVRGYQAAVDVLEKKSKREYYIFISAKSLSLPLEQLRIENNESTIGLEFWINKKSDEKTSPYILAE